MGKALNTHIQYIEGGKRVDILFDINEVKCMKKVLRITNISSKIGSIRV